MDAVSLLLVGVVIFTRYRIARAVGEVLRISVVYVGRLAVFQRGKVSRVLGGYCAASLEDGAG